MATCISLITGHFTRSSLCTYNPKSGITKAWILNLDDILKGTDSKTTTTIERQGVTIRSLFLKDSKKLYRLEGQEENFQATHAFVQNPFNKAISHTFIYRLPYNGEDQLEQVQNLLTGAKCVVIAKHLDRGEYGDTEFRVYGYESGLSFSDSEYDSNANSGTIGLTLSSKEGQEESSAHKLLIIRAPGTDDTDGTADDVYTTEAAITALEAT